MYNKCNDSLNSENNKEMLENIITVLKSIECCSAAPKKKPYKNAAKTINNLYYRSFH